jgi:predicted CoA-binding protein
VDVGACPHAAFHEFAFVPSNSDPYWTPSSKRSKLEAVKTVAIIGASNNRTKFGNKAVRAFLRQGYTVFPVNPHENEVEGLPVFRNVREVPRAAGEDQCLFAAADSPAGIARHRCARCEELWLNPGTESEEVLAQARQLGLNVIQACSILGVGDAPD